MAGVAVAALVVAACGGEPNRIDDAGDRPQAIARTEETTTTASGDDKRQEVTDAFLAARETFGEATETPDPSNPALDATHTGYLLEHARAVLGELAEQGIVMETPVDSQSRDVVTSVRFENDDEDFQHLEGVGEVAVLEVCTVDDSGQVRRDTGEPAGEHQLVTLRLRAAMVKEDGTWKLSELLQDDVEQGVAACPGGT